MSERPSLLVGLVGPTGCGKSTVAGWLTAHGGVRIDADAIARVVTAPGEPGHDAVLARFGDAYRRADGSLDRAALGRLVFAHAAALADLEAIVHPLVRPRILAAIEAARAADSPVIALEAIRLLEGGYASLCDEVWLITCPADIQLERLIARGLTPADARQRAAAQAERVATWTRAATRIIDTSGSLADVHSRIERELADAIARRLDTSAGATEPGSVG